MQERGLADQGLRPDDGGSGDIRGYSRLKKVVAIGAATVLAAGAVYEFLVKPALSSDKNKAAARAATKALSATEIAGVTQALALSGQFDDLTVYITSDKKGVPQYGAQDMAPKDGCFTFSVGNPTSRTTAAEDPAAAPFLTPNLVAGEEFIDPYTGYTHGAKLEPVGGPIETQVALNAFVVRTEAEGYSC
jgi:hypothetical protein